MIIAMTFFKLDITLIHAQPVGTRSDAVHIDKKLQGANTGPFRGERVNKIVRSPAYNGAIPSPLPYPSQSVSTGVTVHRTHQSLCPQFVVSTPQFPPLSAAHALELRASVNHQSCTSCCPPNTQPGNPSAHHSLPHMHHLTPVLLLLPASGFSSVSQCSYSPLE